ncbi:hypothetical protein NDU88_004395, partial [Pleurodeles waltl]
TNEYAWISVLGQFQAAMVARHACGVLLYYPEATFAPWCPDYAWPLWHGKSPGSCTATAVSPIRDEESRVTQLWCLHPIAPDRFEAVIEADTLRTDLGIWHPPQLENMSCCPSHTRRLLTFRPF